MKSPGSSHHRFTKVDETDRGTSFGGDDQEPLIGRITSDAAVAKSHKHPEQWLSKLARYCLLIEFLTEFSNNVLTVPLVSLIERAVCENYYHEHDQIALSSLGPVDEVLCKIPEIQGEIAKLRGWKAFFETLAGMAPAPIVIPRAITTANCLSDLIGYTDWSYSRKGKPSQGIRSDCGRNIRGPPMDNIYMWAFLFQRLVSAKRTSNSPAISTSPSMGFLSLLPSGWRILRLRDDVERHDSCRMLGEKQVSEMSSCRRATNSLRVGHGHSFMPIPASSPLSLSDRLSLHGRQTYPFGSPSAWELHHFCSVSQS